MIFQTEKLFTNQSTQKLKRNDGNGVQPNSPRHSQTIKANNNSTSNPGSAINHISNNRGKCGGAHRRYSLGASIYKGKLFNTPLIF